MQKLIALLLSLIMVLSIVTPAMAGEHYIDYRSRSIVLPNGTKAEKPVANFAVDVVGLQGIKASTETANNTDATNTPAPVIQAVVGDTLIFTDKSIPSTGQQLVVWDWQYWTEDQQIFELKSKMDKELQLTVPGRYHFYLAVGDNVPVNKSTDAEKFWLWDYNWSANGNHRAVKELDNQFTGWLGYWYFQEIIVEVAENSEIIATEPHESKDAWTTSTHFNPGKTLSQRYNNGDTVDLKFIFHNEAKDIAYGDTNYVITHWGTGTQGAFENQTMPAVKKGAATEELSYTYTIDLDKVPDSAKINSCIRLVIIGDPDKKVANSDGKKNYMTVNIPINGVDIMVLVGEDHTVNIKQGETTTLNLGVSVIQNLLFDENKNLISSRDPITVDVNIKSPTGTITERITIVPFTDNRCKDYELPFTTGTAGVYVIEASAYPVGVWDVDPTNNEDKCSVTVRVGPADEPYKGNTDKEIRVNLVG